MVLRNEQDLGIFWQKWLYSEFLWTVLLKFDGYSVVVVAVVFFMSHPTRTPYDGIDDIGNRCISGHGGAEGEALQWLRVRPDNDA